MKKPRHEYLNQATLRAEIWKSKLSYCSVRDIDPPAASTDTIPDHDSGPVILWDTSYVPEGFIGKRGISLPFHPFRVIEVRGGEVIELSRAFWRDGVFCPDAGRTTDKLGRAYMELADRISRKSNWAGYSYRDEMAGQGLIALVGGGLKYDHTRTDNAFAYCSQIVHNAFLRILKVEKQAQTIRDDLLIEAGVAPSMTRQIEHTLH